MVEALTESISVKEQLPQVVGQIQPEERWILVG